VKVENHERWFYLGCLLEAALVVVAAALGPAFEQPVLQLVHWNWHDGMLGVLGSAPILALFLSALGSRRTPLADIRQLLETVVRPIFDKWPLWQLAMISILAGIGEEALFRGLIQGALAKWLGPAFAVIIGSLVFGLAHPMSWGYVIIAGLLGAYLGWLWLFTGNLLTSMVAPAMYDFTALVYFLRLSRTA
jgi:hypothetical protein